MNDYPRKPLAGYPIMILKLVSLLFSLTFLLSCFSCSKPGGIPAGKTVEPAQVLTSGEKVYTDALKHRYVLKEIPRRIISLNPSVTEILFAIGAGDRVVGVTQYCDYPSEARTRTQVGGFSGATVSMEQIRFLNPDLVILSAEMHSRIVPLLDDLGIPSFAVEPANFSEVYETISLLGEITGCADGAKEVVADMKSRIAAVEEQLKNTEPKSVFWILGINPLMTAGSGTFVSEALSLGGGKNIFDDIQERWPLVSAEQVLLRKPEWILMGDDMTGGSAGQGSSDPMTIIPGSLQGQAIPAVREKRVAVLNGDLVYRYGPRLADAVEAIAKILHGDR